MRARQAGAAGARFLDPRVLARIRNLELVARSVVDGFIHGLHRAPYLGLSLDFAEHRPYMPGDDIRRVDWRLYARTDRYYVKEYEAETNANLVVVLDASRSMDYASRGLTKLDYARTLAACLTYFSHRQRDRVGLAVLDGGLSGYVPASAKHLDVVLHTLERVRPGGAAGGSARDRQPAADETDTASGDVLASACRRLSDLLGRRGIIAWVSDLYEEPAAVAASLGQLRAAGQDVVVFHVLDPAEREFPFTDPAGFRDMETGELLPLAPERIREDYRALVDAHVSEMNRVLGESRMDYALLDTATPLDHALFAYLSARERLSRARR